MPDRQHTSLAFAFAALLTLAGCGGSSDSDSGPTGELQLFHAASDAPEVDVFVNGNQALTEVPFGTASGFLEVSTDPSVTVEVSETGNEVFSGSVELSEDQRRTVVARGLSDNGTQLEIDILEEPTDTPADDETRLRAYHAAPQAPTSVDAYVGDPSKEASTIVANNEPTVADLSLGETTDFQTQAAGDIRVVLTAAGNNQVAYNSGRVSTVGGANITVAAIDSSRSISPVATVALTGTSDPGPGIEWQDARPGVRLAHLSPDAGDVTVNLSWQDNQGDSQTADVPVSYKDVSGYFAFGEDVDTLNASVAGISADVALKDADGDPRDLTVAVVGLAGGGSPELAFRPLEDDLSPTPLGQANLRAVHAAPESTLSQDPGVDLYVNESGTGDNEFTVDPLLFESEIPFNAATEYFDVPSADYRVDVTPATTTTRELTVDPVTLSSRDTVTAFVIGDGSNDAPVELLPVVDQFGLGNL